MRTSIPNLSYLVLLTSISIPSIAFSQEDPSEEIRSVLQASSPADSLEPIQAAEDSEDIPPPLPVPDNNATPPPAQPVPSTPPNSNTTPTSNPSVTGQEQRAYGFGISFVPTTAGLKVQGVLVGSAAASTGIRPNDLIVAVNGQAANSESLTGNLESVDVIRGGVRSTLPVSAASAAEAGVASYIPQDRSAYSVPRSADQTTAYRVPANANEQPRRFSSAYEYVPNTAYQARPYSYRRYYGASRPGFSVGYGTAIGIGPGFGGYRGFGYGPGIGYGRGVGVGFGRGFGRSGVSIRIGF